MNFTDVQRQLKVFISYSHRDEEFKKSLEDHLAGLKNSDKIQIWQDRKIIAGTEWNQQILEEFDAADIILLLISARFLNSEFCYSKEMKRAMMRHEQQAARVIPIILAPCVWSSAPFSKLGVLPTDGKAITEWSNPDSAYTDVARGVARAVDHLIDMKYGSAPKADDGWGTPPPQGTSGNTGQLDSKPLEAATSSAQDAPSPKPLNATQQRLALFQLLSSLPGPTFDAVVYALNVPPPLMPPAIAPQGQRVPALLNWANSPVGCGLEELEAVIETILDT